MEEIKIGEYVRTSIGKIYKLTEKKQEQIENYPKFLQYIEQKSIVKHSFNIIDLIEYDDVLEIFVNDNDIQKIVVYGDELYSLKIGELIAEDIKSIVTHEQFQSLEYRLEE